MDKKNDIQNLLLDHSFLNWVNNSNKADVERWDAWLDEHPEMRALAEEAGVLVNGFQFKKSHLAEHQAKESWEKLSDRLQDNSSSSAKVVPLRKFVWRAAAVLLVLILSVWGIRQMNSSPALLTFETGPLETRLVELPDGSSVQLNTYSKLSYTDNWLDQPVRTLHLDGEAYFNIATQPSGKRLRVVANDMKVDVLGTAFNLNSKRKLPIVSLTEGKINLIAPGNAEKILHAGETAFLNKNLNSFDIQPGQTDYWQAWTLQKWALGDGTPLSEILQRFGETYDMQYEVDDPAFLQKVAIGDISVESRDILLESLEVLFDLQFTVKQNKLHVTYGDPQ